MRAFGSAQLGAFVAVVVACLQAPCDAQPLRVRVMPPPRAELLQYQRFDLRVEATARDSGARIESLQVMLDGVEVTAHGDVESPSPGIRNWTLRDCALTAPGARSLRAVAGGKSAAGTIEGEGRSDVTVRPLRGVSRLRAPAAGESAIHDLDALAGASSSSEARNEVEPDRPRARNVILFIGDGMGLAQRTAARVLARGYSSGRADGLLAMDTLPFNGMLMTSSLDSLITDSAAGAHAFATGNKTNNGMEGVFPDNTTAEADNPRIENLAEWLARYQGKATGIVTDATATDATPAAMLVHVQNRGNGPGIASLYADTLRSTRLTVLLAGGRRDFIPRTQIGSTRADDRNLLADFASAGFDFVQTRSALRGVDAPSTTRLLGLFALGNMNGAFDKLHLGDPAIVASEPDQPFLDEMTLAAIAILERQPEGFFLMVEAAHIDKQAHGMDAERAIYDVIQLDRAVAVGLAFARRTNADDDPSNDTLVIVTADHETAGVALPGVSRPEMKGSRDYVKTYGYGGARNDPSTLNFTDYEDADDDGYPDDPDPARKLVVAFGAASDHYEDWQSNARPKAPSVVSGGVAVANPDDPDRYALGGRKLAGVVENGERGGAATASAVHTMVDVPVSAFGPGAAQFSRIADNTEVFFNIVNAVTGGYGEP